MMEREERLRLAREVANRPLICDQPIATVRDDAPGVAFVQPCGECAPCLLRLVVMELDEVQATLDEMLRDRGI